ncbi:MAG TPA: flagellar biosynthetic protein FliQ [Gemmatimonas sp.]|uniref:flagellar biosynthetic protein FliQ n=1 Tax=Gemmatimonas sp. TaxID=1962908 RepID=UPI002EDA98A5
MFSSNHLRTRNPKPFSGLSLAFTYIANSAFPRTQATALSHQIVIDLTRDAIMTALMISAPLLLLALGVGLIIAIIQSVTQIQEQTLVFVPKLILVGGAFIVGLPWLMQIMIKFTTQIIRGIPAMVG